MSYTPLSVFEQRVLLLRLQVSDVIAANEAPFFFPANLTRHLFPAIRTGIVGTAPELGY